MTRPRKNVVDYFPHDCITGKTFQILTSRFGNNGRAFWWVLLESLGNTENHFIDCNNPIDWEFLSQKSLCDGITVTDMLNFMALLGMIDARAWDSKIVWCQNFVNRISDVYRKRGTEIPAYPEFLLQKYEDKGITDSRNPQSKVKESKEKKRTNTVEIYFDDFWKSYPNKVSKKDAIRAFIKINPDDNLFDKMLKAIENQKQWRETARPGEFRPVWKNPATWLNGECWDDDLDNGNGNGNGLKMVANPVKQEFMEFDEYE